MNNLQRGLGRGLDALLGGTSMATDTVPPTTLPLDSIVPNPSQPRRHFSKEAMEELAASIRSQGIIQPLLVRHKKNSDLYEIVAGERRWRAAGLASLTTVPVLIRDLSDEEVLLASLIENLQREDLNPIEEALALQSLREHCQLTQEELGTKLGKSRAAIANSLRLLSLSLEAQDDVQFGRINAGHARSLLSITEDDARERLRRAIIERNLTVRDAETATAVWKNSSHFPWETEESLPTALPASNPPVPSTRKVAPRRKPTALKALQKRLAEHFSLKTSISGSEDCGRITLNYSTAQELSALLQHLGIDTPVENPPH